jgi:hypothetical protein
MYSLAGEIGEAASFGSEGADEKNYQQLKK